MGNKQSVCNVKKRQASTSTDLAQAVDDPFTYTSGRWLHRDEVQRSARFIRFNFPVLCQKAIDVCPGAKAVLRYEKKEGGFNRVFILYMDNGARLIARLPFSIAGPRSLTTHSEVATMAYIESNTNIPVPKVLDWSCDDQNPVGAEYIIMHCASGVQLHEVWPTMNTHQHMLVTKALAKVIAEMAKLEFPAYGSLYYDHGANMPEKKISLADGFTIGPHCGKEYWDTKKTDYEFEYLINRGPWRSLEDYAGALLDAGYQKLPKEQSEVNGQFPYQGSIEEHRRLLRTSKSVVMKLLESPAIRKASSAILLHCDLNKRNIFVSAEDPTKITAIIDWQSTCIEPAFVYANETPDLVTLPQDLLNIPEMNTELDANTDLHKKRERLKKDYLICQQTFEIALRGYAPKLAAARAIDETLIRLFRYCHSSWRDSAAVLRQELIELSQRWHELGVSGSCPYQPSAEELAEHAKQWEDFESTQKFKLFLMKTLDATSDGWVPTENWEAAKQIHKASFEQWMETVRESDDPEMNEVRGSSLWPWDER